MTNNVDIIMASIHMNDGEKNELEVRYSGERGKVGKTHIIKYNEYEEDKLTNRNTIFIKEDSIRTVKVGAVEAEMTFVKDKITKTSYKTPYGNIEMDIKTHLICVDINDSVITVKVLYSMLVHDAVVSDTSIVMIIKNT